MVPPKKKKKKKYGPTKERRTFQDEEYKRPCITSKSNSFPINKNQPKGNITV